jgi:hypothetical protein
MIINFNDDAATNTYALAVTHNGSGGDHKVVLLSFYSQQVLPVLMVLSFSIERGHQVQTLHSQLWNYP